MRTRNLLGVSTHTLLKLLQAKASWAASADKFVGNLLIEPERRVRMIEENTLIPFYRPLIKESASPMSRWSISGIHRPIPFIRYCPECVSRSGEFFIKRSWLLPWVRICPEHNRPLMKTTLATSLMWKGDASCIKPEGKEEKVGKLDYAIGEIAAELLRTGPVPQGLLIDYYFLRKREGPFILRKKTWGPMYAECPDCLRQILWLIAADQIPFIAFLIEKAKRRISTN